MSDTDVNLQRQTTAMELVKNPPAPELDSTEDNTKKTTEDKSKGKGGRDDEDFDPHVYEQRINDLTLDIEIKTTKNTKFLMRNWRKDNSFDPSWGRCCCYYGNRRGAKIILLIDFIFFVNLLRWPFAALAICNSRDKLKF